MKTFTDSELILTKSKRLYHINLKDEDIADNVILVGDQNRVPEISNYFSRIDFKTEHREFITHTGFFKGKRITVLSTGIGTDNIDIVLNELDAAININVENRVVKKKLRRLNLFRLGTSGALQKNIKINDLVISKYGLGLDGLLNFYKSAKIREEKISKAFIKHSNWPKSLAYPYCIAADKKLFEHFKNIGHFGITATAPGFYAPQGRELRLAPAISNINNLLSDFHYKNTIVTNFEMETSALYGLGKMLNHRCLTICVIIANRIRKEFSNDYKKSTKILIETGLNKISDLQ